MGKKKARGTLQGGKVGESGSRGGMRGRRRSEGRGEGRKGGKGMVSIKQLSDTEKEQSDDTESAGGTEQGHEDMCSLDDKEIRHKRMSTQKSRSEYGFCFIHLTQSSKKGHGEQRKTEKITALVLKRRPNARSPAWWNKGS